MNDLVDIIGSSDLGCALSNYKKYDRYPLNNLEAITKGLEKYRVLESYSAAKKRGCPQEFLDTGVLVLENFYSTQTHSFILKEINKFPLRINKNVKNLLRNCSLYNFTAESLSKAVFDTIKYTDMVKFDANTFIQRISDKSAGHLLESDGKDSQFRIHSDIFSPAIKYWYFPEEVTLEHGPLMYAKHSCEPSESVLNFWLEESIKIVSGNYIEPWKEPSHSEGSLRIEEQELLDMGYFLEPLCVPANTLALVNVHGFHRRGEHSKIRNSIHGSIRIDNPF